LAAGRDRTYREDKGKRRKEKKEKIAVDTIFERNRRVEYRPSVFYFVGYDIELD